MTISIRGARVIDPASGLDQVGDLHIEAGKIVAIGAAPAGFSAQKTLDGVGLVAAPDWSTSASPCASRATDARATSKARPAPPRPAATSLCCPPTPGRCWTPRRWPS